MVKIVVGGEFSRFRECDKLYGWRQGFLNGKYMSNQKNLKSSI